MVEEPARRADVLSARPSLLDARALAEAGRAAEALAVLDPALRDPAPSAGVLLLAAEVHEELGFYDRAFDLLSRCAASVPWSAELHQAMVRVRARQGRLEEALALAGEGLARQPRDAEALFNRANVLRLLHRREEAIAAYREVLPLDAGLARVALVEIARQQLALHDLDGARISAHQLYLVTGGSLDSIGHRLGVEYHAWPPDPAGVGGLARRLGEELAARIPTAPSEPRPRPRPHGRRLRVGLVSPDLWSHPVGYFLEPLLASAAARDADWWVYSDRRGGDAQTERLRTRVDGWHDVADRSDAQVAQQVRDDGIDVLVDLAGHSRHNRLATFASRPAPVQLTWLGYHGTTGMPFLDGLLADPSCVPAGEERFLVEPVLRLPRTRLCLAPPVDAPAVADAPALRAGTVTFGCFQHSLKLGPQVLAAWARIAAELPKARWVVTLGDSESGPSDHERLRRRGEEVGFAPAHLEVRGVRPRAEYLAAYAEVDVLLDTFPYPGGTTTAEALWMGVPTLTLATPGMLGRQGQQLLTAAGMAEWVTHDVEEYVARAVELGREAPGAPWSHERTARRDRLRGTPLFDGERFGRDWMAVVGALVAERTGGGGAP